MINIYVVCQEKKKKKKKKKVLSRVLQGNANNTSLFYFLSLHLSFLPLIYHMTTLFTDDQSLRLCHFYCA
jgi:hypothetical protein